jgi:hypothetical protein
MSRRVIRALRSQPRRRRSSWVTSAQNLECCRLRRNGFRNAPRRPSQRPSPRRSRVPQPRCRLHRRCRSRGLPPQPTRLPSRKRRRRHGPVPRRHPRRNRLPMVRSIHAHCRIRSVRRLKSNFSPFVPAKAGTQRKKAESSLGAELVSRFRGNERIDPCPSEASPAQQRHRKNKSAPDCPGRSALTEPSLPEQRSNATYAAALASTTCGLLWPLMAIWRGFLASGISRTRSTCRRPFSSDAPLTWT